MENRKSGVTIAGENTELIQNLKRKRPNLTKLDIEKLFEQSIELTEIHRKLYEENKKLKKDLQKVQQSKNQRQQFISQVEKIVKQKSQELTTKNPQQSSWLVFKLQQKISELKQQIQAKDKAIRKLNLSKQNQALFKKQAEIQCLREINQFAESIGIAPMEEGIAVDEDFQEIIWMDDYLVSEREKVEELEGELQQEEMETKRILTSIAAKKTELKKIKELEKEYLSVQENYMQEKKKKEEKMVDNKSYLANLIKERDQQNQRLEKLKSKQAKICNEQTLALVKLSQKLENLKKIYQANKHHHIVQRQDTNVSVKQESTEQWVKKVSLHEVETLAKNLNLCLALKGVTQDMWIEQFFKDGCQVYSIQQVMQKLQAAPFELASEPQRKLLARYVVEDSDSGMMLQDLKTSQDAPIIKSILSKLISPTKVYSAQEVEHYREELGNKLAKFWSLVEQAVHIREGVRNLVTREMLEEGIHSAELQLTNDELEYVVLYLFSWSHDITKLELNKLGKLRELGIRFEAPKSQ